MPSRLWARKNNRPRVACDHRYVYLFGAACAERVLAVGHANTASMNEHLANASVQLGNHCVPVLDSWYKSKELPRKHNSSATLQSKVEWRTLVSVRYLGDEKICSEDWTRSFDPCISPSWSWRHQIFARPADSGSCCWRRPSGSGMKRFGSGTRRAGKRKRRAEITSAGDVLENAARSGAGAGGGGAQRAETHEVCLFGERAWRGPRTSLRR